jgi:hypothetical protein
MVGQGIQGHDVVATRRSDGRYDLQQWLQGQCRFLEGPIDAIEAEARVIATAKQEQSDAWIEEMAGIVRCLS